MNTFLCYLCLINTPSEVIACASPHYSYGIKYLQTGSAKSEICLLGCVYSHTHMFLYSVCTMCMEYPGWLPASLMLSCDL